MELKQIFEVQRNFDRKMGWNKYEECNTPEAVLDFMQHFMRGTVEEKGEGTLTSAGQVDSELPIF